LETQRNREWRPGQWNLSERGPSAHFPFLEDEWGRRKEFRRRARARPVE
jgi:hypothetical protein